MTEETCSHLNAITEVKHPTRRECEECVKIGASWVHLRTCQTCGVTRCCDDSPNRHATKHAHASGHPVIASAEPGERWLYCYPDDAFASTRFWRVDDALTPELIRQILQKCSSGVRMPTSARLRCARHCPFFRLEDGAKMVAVLSVIRRNDTFTTLGP